MKYLIIVFSFSFASMIFAQKAKKITINNIIWAEFVTNSPSDSMQFFRFCKTVIKKGNKDISFDTDRAGNYEVIQHYPQLIAALDSPITYYGNKEACISLDDITDLMTNYNVERSPYYIYYDSRTIYSSEIFYTDYPDTNRVAIIFRLKAQVNLYKDIGFFDNYEGKTYLVSHLICEDCWEYVTKYGTTFMILDRIIAERPLSKWQIKRLGLKKYQYMNLNVIPPFGCDFYQH